ncbi:Similar to Zinc finger CCCH domain-containing protein 45; acc. no. Q0DA50 [Pyronema omphalodes CBS 100304]|uniref:Similar to Zinc finger CCCH domain-containing protein 45 acc. no. Q0DA50 n=1 Tax=Pyronema omphalodes (strain CBS 100304) TaxID=1076935 RepID=U4LHI8_PYROM|nr:Similar to Zinc finger CCCH domain-containing protein 45; acc. no. Q0DA50 [Pyronema omphalodes CBS 100304]
MWLLFVSPESDKILPSASADPAISLFPAVRTLHGFPNHSARFLLFLITILFVSAASTSANCHIRSRTTITKPPKRAPTNFRGQTLYYKYRKPTIRILSFQRQPYPTAISNPTTTGRTDLYSPTFSEAPTQTTVCKKRISNRCFSSCRYIPVISAETVSRTPSQYHAYAPYAPHYLTANEFGFPTGPVTVFPYSSSYPRFSTEMSVMPVPQPWYPSHPHHHHQHSAPAVYYTMPQQHMGYLPHNTQPQMIPHGQMVYPNEPHLRRHSVPRRPINMQISPARMTPISPPAPNFQATNSNIGNSPNVQAPTPQNISDPPSPLSAVLPSIPRGPPRKPKQTGNALWVGNLPPDTDISALKDHFSHGAKDEIQSVFLISKTSCAFVNYLTENGCLVAMARFHNSNFNGSRLVCKLRKTAEPEHAEHVEHAFEAESGIEASVSEADSDTESIEAAPETAPGGLPCTPASNSKFRYFILKSLTVEDLDMSVRTVTWATQEHNETVLNEAFDAAESVFLVFSANKSGEYYGYARMASRIGDEGKNSLQTAQFQSQSQSTSSSNLLVPRTTYTPETDTAPRGQIVDDSSRGTLFWERLYDDEMEDTDAKSQPDGDSSGSISSAQRSWGIPFRIEWISTTRVPFFKTRGIRNYLNAGREVKVARDGTVNRGLSRDRR